MVINLTGGADRLLERFTKDPSIVAGQAKFSLEQLRRKQERLFEAAAKEGDPIVIGVDMKANRVRAVAKRAGKAAAKLKGSGLTGEDSEVIEVQDPIATVASASGARIRSQARTTTTPSGGTWNDTASLGFAVTYTNSAGASARGYVTAAHFDECKPSSGIVLASCAVNQPATEVASGATLNFVRQNFTTDHDVELRSTTSTAIAPTNVVRYGGGGFAYTSYSITGTGSFSLSYPVCKQGQTTFYTCGTVTDTATLVSDASSGLYGRFVRIQPNSGTPKMADHGDSGGPVFAGGGLALGLVTGAFLDPASPYYNQMVSMPISRLSGISASVLTVP